MRFRELDAIRGLAALFVVFHHCLLSLPQNQQDAFLSVAKFTPLKIIADGRPLVIVFFVLSGFVLTVALGIDPVRSYRGFVIKRIFRIYVPYFVSLAVSVAIYFSLQPSAVPQLTGWFNATWADGVSLEEFAENALLLGTVKSASLNNVNWSLVYELRISMMFPLLFESLALFGALSTLTVVLIISVASDVLLFTLGAGPTPYFAQTFPRAFFSTFHFLIFFAAGAALAFHVQSERFLLPRLNHRQSIVIAIAACLTLMVGIDLVNGVGAILLMVLALASQPVSIWLQGLPLQFLGRISFSLYLVHIPILIGLTHLAYGHLSQVLIIALAILCSLVLATVGYRYVEYPAMGLGRSLARLQSETPAA